MTEIPCFITAIFLFFVKSLRILDKHYFCVIIMLSLFFYKNTPMKKLVKKLHKAEAERTKVQKIVRDVAFF